MDQFSERTIGLAGIFQAARLVQQLAREGEAGRIALKASLNSILVLDAINSLAVFSDTDGITTGLECLQRSLKQQDDMLNSELLKYVVSMTQLQKNLFSSAKYDEFSSRVEQLSAYSGDDLITRMADVYVEYVSPLTPKVIVNGEHNYLSEEPIAQQVRACLLSGIRASILWHQKGGGKWDLMMKRRQYIQTAESLIA